METSSKMASTLRQKKKKKKKKSIFFLKKLKISCSLDHTILFKFH